MENKILLLSFSVLLLSCMKDADLLQTTIEVESDIICNDLIIDSVEHIQLRTTDEFLIGEVSDVKKWNNCWYVLDNKFKNAICVFKNDGTPLYVYNNIGRGPGEYIKINDFDVDGKTGNVCVLTEGGRLILLDSTLSFIKEIDTENYSYTRVAWFADGILFFDYNKSAVDHMDLSTDDINRVFATYKDAYNVFNHEPVFHSYKDRMFFHTETDDNIYEITSELDFKPILQLNYKHKSKAQRFYRNNIGDNLSIEDNMRLVRPKINFILPLNSSYTLGYTFLISKIHCIDEAGIVDGILQTFGTIFEEGNIIGTLSANNYNPEDLKKIYDGIKVNYIPVNDENKQNANPILLVHHLRE